MTSQSLDEDQISLTEIPLSGEDFSKKPRMDTTEDGRRDEKDRLIQLFDQLLSDIYTVDDRTLVSRRRSDNVLLKGI